MKRVSTLLAVALIALSACKKDLQAPEQATQAGQQVPDNGFFKKDRPTPDMVRPGAPQQAGNHYALRGPKEFTDELPTVLGNQLPNPYTTANMAAAYNLVYGTNYTELPVTDLYVRFEPNADAQVALLEDSLDLDLYDHPLDHELLQDGDYYVHPGKTVEDLPWLYTTVKPDFQFPAGVPYTILAQLHLPGDDNLFMEELAESMVAGATYTRSIQNGQAQLTRTDVPEQPSTGIPYCDFEDPLNPGTFIPCPPTGGGGPASPVCGLPAQQCTNSKLPKGRLRVWDTQKNACVPLAGVQVFSKRWFKGVNRPVYTDAQGGFTASQRFSGIVKVMVQFRNNTISARPLRFSFAIRFSLLPLRSKLGSFSGCLMNTIDQIYYRGTDRSSKGFLYWLAAHAVNARAEQWAQAAADGLKVMDNHRLVVYLQRGGEEFNRRPEAELLLQSYLFKKRGLGEWIFEYGKLSAYLAEHNIPGAALTVLNNVLGGQRPDIVYRYNTLWENLSSSEVNQQFYSVYAQAGLLKAVESGESSVKWKRYFKGKGKGIDVAVGMLGFGLKILFKQVKAYLPNGYFDEASLANMVATLGLAVYYDVSQPDREFYNQVLGFGEYYGHYLADKRYVTLADPILNQKRERVASDPVTLTSSHKKYLEDWNPNEPLDEIKYDREGLFNDLEDINSVPPEQVPFTSIQDLVSGIKAKDYEKAIMGGAVYANPELWDQCRENLKYVFPLQADKIVDLYRAYNVW
jgi:hypothetical protein